FAAGERIDRVDAIGAPADAQIFAALSRAPPRDAVGPGGRDPAADRAWRCVARPPRELFAQAREPPRQPPCAFAAFITLPAPASEPCLDIDAAPAEPGLSEQHSEPSRQLGLARARRVEQHMR